ncbi:MAG: hypothetical protein QE263_04445 [Vampirovibrionales bacterium]|nr:hypothetical protein [Vampirovibrionales bacterium]
MNINAPQFGYLKLIATPNEQNQALKDFKANKELAEFSELYPTTVKTDFGYYLFSKDEWKILHDWFSHCSKPIRLFIGLLESINYNYQGIKIANQEVKQTGILTYKNNTLTLDNTSGEPVRAKF